MIDLNSAKKLALSFPEAEEKPHFQKASFRVKNKIFATLDSEKREMVLKLSQVDQSVFAGFEGSAVKPVPGGWGRQGWTVVELDAVQEDLFKDALTTAYCHVAPDKLGDMVHAHNPFPP